MLTDRYLTSRDVELGKKPKGATTPLGSESVCIYRKEYLMATTGNGNQQIFQEIMLHRPPPLRIQQTKVPTDKVRFDTSNPRLKYKKQLFPDKTDKELLFQEPDTPLLMKDIEEKGIIDPIYVKSLPANAGWMVVEGNRRTAVMQDLQVKHPNDPRFAYIPANVLPAETSAEQEALLMASYHVAGKIKWEAHDKAGHIWYMINVLHLPETELVNTLHMGGPAIKKAAESYGLLEHFKKIDGGKYANEAEGKWSFFAEMLKIKDFWERHKKGQDWDDQFCRWVGEKRIPKAEDVRDLPAILSKLKARTLFENEPTEAAFEKASKEVDKATPSRNSKFYKDLEHIIISGKAASLNDLQAASDNEAARDTLIEAYSVILAFMERAGVRVPGTPRRVA
jgi:hypothetical protein